MEGDMHNGIKFIANALKAKAACCCGGAGGAFGERPANGLFRGRC